MCHELRYVLEIKRMVWLVALVFALVIVFQYFDFVYDDVRSSLFSASNVHVNRSSLSDVLVKVNRTAYSGHDVGVGKDFVSERKQESGNFRESDKNHVPVDQVEEKHKLMLDMVEQTEGSLAPDTVRESVSNLSIDNVNGSTAAPISMILLPSATPVNTTVNFPPIWLDLNTSTADTNVSNSVHNFKEIGTSHGNLIGSTNKSHGIDIPTEKGRYKKPKRKVVSISEMDEILVRNRASSRSMKPWWPSTIDQELLEAKSQIENSPIVENDHILHSSVFRNVSMFKRSYELMEKMLKVYIYKEGEKPIFHQPEAVLKGIYASEGWFMKQMKASKRFVTKKTKQAHLFYIPYSSKLIKATLSPNSYDPTIVIRYLKNYLDVIIGRYSFWNRTGGADHFIVACHDWAAAETRQYMDTCIRALCNTDVEREGFVLGKDAPLPETNVRYPLDPLRELGGKPPSRRSVLAFFAGKMHGNVRPILLRHWENKDPDMKISGKLPTTKAGRNYIQYMKSSKYCICAKGSEVNSPRVVEAIFYECVPVIISDNFVPPFFEILNWESFAVFVQEKDIPNLKNILLSISQRRYLVMQQRVKQVQQHFLWHIKPVKYDIFHMILHSIWYNRVFTANPR